MAAVYGAAVGVAVATLKPGPTLRAPEKVLVPRPETFRRLPTEKEVVEAMGKMLASEVEVALKIFAVRESVMTAAPTTASGTETVEVALMPRRPFEASMPRKFAESSVVAPL